MASPFVIGAAAFYLALSLVGLTWLYLGGYGHDILLPTMSRLHIDLAIGFGTGGAILGAWRVAELRIRAAQRLTNELARIIPAVNGTGIVVLAITSALGEELFFRGAMQTAFGPVIATIVFGVLHGMFDRRFILWMVFATLAGAIFAGITIFTGHILAATVAHALVNGVNLNRITQEFC